MLNTRTKFKGDQSSVSPSKEDLWRWQVYHYFKILSLKVLFSKTQQLVMAVKETFGSGMGTPDDRGQHARHAEQPVLVTSFPTKTEWHGSVDTSLWKGKNVLKWISLYRGFHFSQGIILKIKVKSSYIWAKYWKMTCCYAKGHITK